MPDKISHVDATRSDPSFKISVLGIPPVAIITISGFSDNISSLDANDWDFSEEGRKRQAKRMADFALKLKAEGSYVVADFICPTPEARSLFPADYIVWVDTIKEGRFDDTNKMFIKPDKFDFHVTSQDAKSWAPKIFDDLKK